MNDIANSNRAVNDEEHWRSSAGSSRDLSALHRFPALPISFGISLMLLGFGSWWYHASECTIANSWDAAGMYGVTSFPALYCLVALIPYFQHRIRVLFVPVLQFFFFIGEFYLPFDDHLTTYALIGSSLVMMAVLTIAQRRTHTFRHWLLLACVASAAVGYGMWNLDRQGVMCEPNIGHAIWHVGTCFAILFGGLYLRSQRLRGPAPSVDEESGNGYSLNKRSQMSDGTEFSSDFSEQSSQGSFSIADDDAAAADMSFDLAADDEDDSHV